MFLSITSLSYLGFLVLKLKFWNYVVMNELQYITEMIFYEINRYSLPFRMADL